MRALPSPHDDRRPAHLADGFRHAINPWRCNGFNSWHDKATYPECAWSTFGFLHSRIGVLRCPPNRSTPPDSSKRWNSSAATGITRTASAASTATLTGLGIAVLMSAGGTRQSIDCWTWR